MATEVKKENEPEEKTQELRGFWLTRIIFLRSLAFIYCVAFSVSLFQNKALLGADGILPIPAYMHRLRTHFKLQPGQTRVDSFLAVPTLFWFIPEEHIDTALQLISNTGLVLSIGVFLQGSANMFIMAALWGLYHSIVNVGQQWYAFGWESQLLETGFLAIWLVPVFSIQLLPVNTPTSRLCIYGYRWLIFRIMIGAGLIKIRGDKCWHDLTCMNYHYETQPVPNPLSWFLHHAPPEWHKVETMGNHIIELLLPWLLLIPHRQVAAFAGSAQIFFQVVIITSGNFSFLNWLTMLPSIFCFDDGYLLRFFSKTTQNYVAMADRISVKCQNKPARYQRAVLNGSMGVLLMFLSVPVIQNLLSSRQQMNTSFDSFRLVNTYGAFGSITKERTEVILEGTSEEFITSSTQWVEYEFKCKPGSVDRRPCLISPYHYRLDWLLWFAAFQQYHQNPWFINLIAKLLEGNSEVRKLIDHDPFTNATLPTYIRAQHYRYQYTPLLTENAAVWNRKYLKPYMPPVSLTQLKEWRESNGFLKEPKKRDESTKETRKKGPRKYFSFDRENISYPIVGLFLVAGLLVLRLFRREMDMYYDSSMGVDKDIQELMTRATELDVDDIPRDNGIATTTLTDLTKDCLDDKEKTE
ncbi:lipase maturation factor 1-like isoform X1 [Bolinopsis microptera]|uniref:lipase maturation factor 1-like isoform X1 n=1 Tax=Bolinopsis microptera TaxID=2820187 RepID=UPI00307A7914